MGLPFEQSVLHRLMFTGLPGSSVVERYFRLNEGTTDSANIPEVTLTSDFKISFDLLTTSTAPNGVILGKSNAAVPHILVDASGIIKYALPTAGAGSISVNDGKLHNIDVELVGTLLTIDVDGVNDVSTTISPASITLDQLWRNGFGNFLSGIIANVSIVDAGTPVRFYPIDDNSDILVDDETVLGIELWDSPTLDANWSDNGGGSYTLDGLQGGFSGLTVNTTIGISTRLLVSITVADKAGGGDLFFGASGTLRGLQNGTHTFIIDTGGDASKVQVVAESGVSATVSNISVMQADGYGKVINGSVDDWGLFQQQENGDWLGQELWTFSGYTFTGAELNNNILQSENILTSGMIYRSSITTNGSNTGATTRALIGNVDLLAGQNTTVTGEQTAGSATARWQVRGTAPFSGTVLLSVKELLKVS